jgi:isopenicillin N synthase-like dioxygenase
MASILKTTKVPILDLTSQQELKPNTSTWRSVSREACEALEEYGCFLAVYDGVTQQLDDSIFAAAEELFDLPTETKKKNVNEKPYHGYVGQMPVIPLHEGLGVDYVTNKEIAQRFTHLMWPQGNDRFWYVLARLFIVFISNEAKN